MIDEVDHCPANCTSIASKRFGHRVSSDYILEQKCRLIQFMFEAGLPSGGTSRRFSRDRGGPAPLHHSADSYWGRQGSTAGPYSAALAASSRGSGGCLVIVQPITPNTMVTMGESQQKKLKGR